MRAPLAKWKQIQNFPYLTELGPAIFYKAILSTNINAIHVEDKTDDLRGVRI